MPQDGPKSVVYRSFFSCDDPKGVAECKTSRKSKTISQKLEDKVEYKRKQKNSDVSFSYNEERKDIVSERPTDELYNPSSIQLMEISIGAQKLNQVIDTWSRGIIFDRQSKDIAKDILRGALDLQESLSMLGKLQEASQYMAKLKKKPKEKVDPWKLDGAGIERTTSDRFGYPIRNLEFQSPRLSADGSSRDCFEELREVIKESFARQNLLPKSSSEEKFHFDGRKCTSEGNAYFDRTKNYGEEKTCSDRKKSYSEKKAYFDRTKLDLSLDFPSTSSSQSSIFNSHEFDSFDSSLSKSLEEKPKGPNVIAKLMGLEEIPRKPMQSTLQNHFAKDRPLNHQRPVFDVDLPKARRPHFTFQKVDPQRRTLEELIETVQFKGLMTSKSSYRSKHKKQPSNGSDWKKRFKNDAPPIVIIKPLHLPVSLEEDFRKKKYIREDLNAKEMIRTRKTKEDVPPKLINDQKGALNFSEIHRKLQAELPPLKMPRQEKREEDCGDAVKKEDDKAIKIQENLSSTKIKDSAPVKFKTQKKEVMENKVDKIQKVAPNSRKPTEVGAAKSRDASKLRNPIKLAPTNLKKREKESNITKSRVSQQKGVSSNSTSECSRLTASRKEEAKNAKQVSRLPSTLTVESQDKNVDIKIDPKCEDEHAVTATKITPLEQLPAGEVKDSSGISGNGNYTKSCPCDSTELTIRQKHDIKSTGDADCCINVNSTEKESYKTSSVTKNLLLDSSSFLNQAEYLFHTNACEPIMSSTASLNHYGVADTKLLLDCANELLKHKSFQCTMAAYRVSQIPIKRSKVVISLDQLVAEISEGIEDLRSYCKLSGQALVEDTIRAVLQNDMWCKGVVSGGAWDLGWRNGFILDDIELVVVNIEQIILNGIIDDMLTEFAV